MNTPSPILKARLSAGLSQRELAELSGVAQPNIAAYESGARKPSARMIERLTAAAKPRPSTVLQRHARAVHAIAAEHRASDVRVFGSVARGEDRPGSDVDLLVSFRADATGYDLLAMAEDLEDLLGVPVDIVSEAGLTGRHAEIQREARAL